MMKWTLVVLLFCLVAKINAIDSFNQLRSRVKVNESGILDFEPQLKTIATSKVAADKHAAILKLLDSVDTSDFVTECPTTDTVIDDTEFSQISTFLDDFKQAFDGVNGTSKLVAELTEDFKDKKITVAECKKLVAMTTLPKLKGVVENTPADLETPKDADASAPPSAPPSAAPPPSAPTTPGPPKISGRFAEQMDTLLTNNKITKKSSSQVRVFGWLRSLVRLAVDKSASKTITINDIDATERTFLDCVYNNHYTTDECYQHCYHIAVSPYDKPTYIKAASPVLLKYAATYSVSDWKKRAIAGGVVTDANCRTGYIKMQRTAFAGFDAEHTNVIRITIQIKTDADAATRATNLWAVLDDIIQLTSPDWLKVDTPGGERLDSILVAYQRDVAGKKAVFNQICERLQATHAAKLSALLPAFQHKGACAFASAADYPHGYSFGNTLCQFVVAEGNAQRFLSYWRYNRHPFRTNWSFKDPRD